ncbi:MAG TPA: alpha-L-rhamnosidase C-terminal domain-containing protein [Roseiflexaceae bacterium]|nr:alpha-L-rhamnosidase C-terminal domain-containing protein [Roseiflexaceae bacterium]
MERSDPFLSGQAAVNWRERGHWPAAWVGCAGAQAPFVAAFRLKVSLVAPLLLRAHVSADERYELLLDGRRIGRGPERGAPECWFYESYELALSAGHHTLLALVWALGPQAALAQMSVQPGFLLAAEAPWGAQFSTGHAGWEARLIDGYRFLDPSPAHWRGARIAIDGQAFPWGYAATDDPAWQPAQQLGAAMAYRSDWEFEPHHLLQPGMLPPQEEHDIMSGVVRHVAVAEGRLVQPEADLPHEHAVWADLLAGRVKVELAAGEVRRVIFDLGQYACAYAGATLSGGAGGMLRMRWAEALFEADNWRAAKGDRHAVDGKYFIGIGDTFLPDGGIQRQFEPLWWSAGRYLELTVAAGSTPLTIERLMLRSTRYPLAYEGGFAADDRRLERLIPILVRGMQMCAHETYMDCPYYEELMYAGDTRLEALTTYVMTHDTRLIRKALQLFDASRLPSGLTQSRFPSRRMQIIAPFALWWVGMVYDYAFWRDDAALVHALLPGVRATIEAFTRYRTADGLLRSPEGWNTLDWVPAWEAGIPPEGVGGISGLLNWQLAWSYGLAAELEIHFGEAELAARLRRLAAELAERATATFWNEARGLFADDPAQTLFSEHTQCMALLSGLLAPTRQAQVLAGLLHDTDLAETTIYFRHYLFEALYAAGRADRLLERMDTWFALEQIGCMTPLESPEPSRSDCHAWGSHPLYHYAASLLGVRPASPGFRTVRIAPQPGPLTRISGHVPHPLGMISGRLQTEGHHLRAQTELPAGLSGDLRGGIARHALYEGRQSIEA